MKYICIIMVVAVFFAFGCGPKTIAPAQRPVTSVTERPLVGKDDGSRRGSISEEELARIERERLLRGQEGAADAILKDISFEFNIYTIASSELPKIEGVGNWLRQEKTMRVIVEGHCDERGTVEYNLALGQKRAEAVKDYLVKTGVETSRIKTTSFGKEVPVDQGHTEEAWAKNRRAHFRIDQKG